MKKMLQLFIGVGFFCSCCKDKPKEKMKRLIPDELRAYWDFKPGSYWIYKDSVKGTFDSVYVTDRVNFTDNGILNYTGEDIIFEYLKVYTHNYGDGFDYNYGINTQFGSSYYQNSNNVFSDKSKPSQYIDAHTCFVYPFTPGIFSYNAYGGGPVDSVIFKNYYSSLYGFNDVVKQENTLSSFENYKRAIIYCAKNVGIIRYEVPDSNKYKILINYHINP